MPEEQPTKCCMLFGKCCCRAGVKDDLIASEALAKDYKLKLCSSCLSDQRA